MTKRGASLLLLGLLSSCESDLPDPAEGNRITGKVTYTGSGAAALHSPALSIAAFPEFPPKGPPRGSVVFVNPTFPVSYELKNVPTASYKIVAEIVDLADPGAMGRPSGAYPNLCAVIFSPFPNVAVSPTQGKANVDITMYDGGADPCFSQPPPMPDAAVTDIDGGI
jgi:hypothetical protein